MDTKIEQSSLFIELNKQTKNKIKISPIGEIIGLDKRVFIVDSNSVLKNTKNRMLDIVLNKNHLDSEAFGWFNLNSLEEKEDGIYATLELNNLGEEAVKNRHYRYLSPEYLVNSNREVVAIIGMGLVNHPNLLNKAINKTKKEEKSMDKTRENELQKELNSSNAKVLTLEKEINTQKKENETLKTEIKSLKEANKTNEIEVAIASGELLPSQKEFALSLDINSIDGYLNSVKESNLQITKNLKNNIDTKNKSTNEQEEKELNATLKNMGWE